jgi:hypothetical protein
MSCCDEYCTNYGCNQGRNCPARVANVGKRHHGAQPLLPSPWKRQLKIGAKWALITISLLFYAALLSAVLSNAS